MTFFHFLDEPGPTTPAPVEFGHDLSVWKQSRFEVFQRWTCWILESFLKILKSRWSSCLYKVRSFLPHSCLSKQILRYEVLNERYCVLTAAFMCKTPSCRLKMNTKHTTTRWEPSNVEERGLGNSFHLFLTSFISWKQNKTEKSRGLILSWCSNKSSLAFTDCVWRHFITLKPHLTFTVEMTI